jgi:hypothetical protein
MSALYGNDLAIQCARVNAQGTYPAGAVLSLVIWKQQEHMFCVKRRALAWSEYTGGYAIR